MEKSVKISFEGLWVPFRVQRLAAWQRPFFERFKLHAEPGSFVVASGKLSSN
jgi:hypothetical protein